MLLGNAVKKCVLVTVYGIIFSVHLTSLFTEVIALYLVCCIEQTAAIPSFYTHLRGVKAHGKHSSTPIGRCPADEKFYRVLAYALDEAKSPAG